MKTTMNFRQATAMSVDVRRERPRLRAQLLAGERQFADVLRDPPACVANARTFVVLGWLAGDHKQGRRRVSRFNALALEQGVNIMRPISELTPRQAEWIIEHLLDVAPQRASRRDLVAA